MIWKLWIREKRFSSKATNFVIDKTDMQYVFYSSTSKSFLITQIFEKMNNSQSGLILIVRIAELIMEQFDWTEYCEFLPVKAVF